MANALPPGFGPPEPAPSQLPAGFGPPEAVQEGPGIGEALARGGAQGLTLGHADELTGALEALKDKLRGTHETIGELYQKHRDESRKNYKAAEQAHPVASTIGNVAGGLGTLAIPGVGELALGKGLLGAAAGGAALGGLAGEGASEAGDIGSIAKDAASGAVGGAIGGGLGYGAGKLIGKGADALASKAGRAGDVHTLKAAGYIGSDMAKLSPEETAQTAALLRNRGIVTPLTTVENAAQRTTEALKGEQAGIGATRKAVDTAYQNAGPGVAAHGEELARALESEVLKPMLADPARSNAAVSRIQELAQNLRDKGPMTAQDVGKFKESLQALVNYGNESAAPGLNTGLRSAAAAARRKELEIAGDISPELGSQLEQHLTAAKMLHGPEDVATRRAQMLAGQNAIPLGGKGDLLGGSMLAAMGHPAAAAALAAKGLLAKGGRQYGNSLLGTALPKVADRLRQVVEREPMKLGKYGIALNMALKKSPAHYATAQMLLSQTDPTYQALKSKLDEENP